MRLEKLHTIAIDLDRGQKIFQFHLSYGEPGKTEPVEFQLTDDKAMELMTYLGELQVQYRIPLPAKVRPTGAPVLAIVSAVR